MQSTLLLKKQIEVEKVQEDLDVKRRQFSDRMSSCKSKEEELKKKQQQVYLLNVVGLGVKNNLEFHGPCLQCM